MQVITFTQIDARLRAYDRELRALPRAIASAASFIARRDGQDAVARSPRIQQLNTSLARHERERAELMKRRAELMDRGAIARVDASTIHLGDVIHTGDYQATVTSLDTEELTARCDHLGAQVLHYYDIVTVECPH